MKNTLIDRLYRRETYGSNIASNSYRKLYSDRRLIDDLDIVNELDGHSGCVNALSWSKSGSLLASGSDDQHLNIYAYQPTTVNSQFQLTATVATGHTQNIFSVKFMPHSQDRTVITAAGDGEVRIFDLEYSGQARAASRASHLATEGRRRGRNTIFDGVRYMSDGDTNCRVYRSHGDRVKRIVTESSPHLFLTCSEDGEVRQWDLRLPSSAYPSPRDASSGNIPPPLISYKRYNLDLNTISCSGSQPHYIALGGAHRHAFLHDRRMTGRDRLAEAGVPLSSPENLSSEQQELLGQATRCVRKFASPNQKKAGARDNGHITACKISDARPDEMVVSWSGDHIYSFDLIRESPSDAQGSTSPTKGSRVKESRDRKRKRKADSSQGSTGRAATARAQGDRQTPMHDTALRIHYGNGQSEDIPFANERVLTEKERGAQRFAKATGEIKSALLSQSSSATSPDPTADFTRALGRCASIMSDMDEAIRNWSYPMRPSPEQVYLQKTLRRNRESTRRFVQTAGTLARVLGGRIQTPSSTSPMIAHFSSVETSNSHLELPPEERFVYDFIKAILLWLDSGIGRLIDGFVRPVDVRPGSKAGTRLPIPEDDATTEAIEDYLIPYLLVLAGDEPIIDVETNRFEIDQRRYVFSNRKAAVIAFARATRTPFADLSSAVVQAEGETFAETQDRAEAHAFWATKVARGLLLDVGRVVTEQFVNRGFGGYVTNGQDGADEEMRETDGAVDEQVAFQSNDGNISSFEESPVVADGEDDDGDEGDDDDDNDNDDELGLTNDDLMEILEEDEVLDEDEDEVNGEDEEDEEEDEDADSEPYESSEPDEEDGVPNLGVPRLVYQSAAARRKQKASVERDIVSYGPTRTYKGHCNVQTVKDVNYFGPDDEYVVSGSDDGNLFIWDRRTSELVNILEGDGEVVNVVQGHPYETMMAVSGIDHTIKIFSPDARARQVARLGQGVSAHDAASFSSLSWPRRRGLRRHIGHRQSATETENLAAEAEDEDGLASAQVAQQQAVHADEDDDYVAPNGLTSRKRMHDCERIVRQNQRQREEGNQEAVITISRQQLLQMLFAHWANA
ncbi:WD40 repeat-like protein [Dissoconium aciculare CBS 342.82]|uniref:WD40 repeat-like protein n=1 Tax=Dissoconium aciculare CBS 342.82 TaxID=1314786 RepID=A0A6J3MLP1_9PEZI|nr:WD40 repeat-like protein [Dissoconium aciculare CBS 342.82]KAF1827907.1 WD40 repeat-like protein [Dissoconium aciculare CBS 342.82]